MVEKAAGDLIRINITVLKAEKVADENMLD